MNQKKIFGVISGILITLLVALVSPLPLRSDTGNLPSAKNAAEDSAIPLEVPCRNCPKTIIAVKMGMERGYITPIAFYADNRYHEINVDLYGEKGKKKIQNYTEMIREAISYMIVQDGADVGKFLVQQVLYQDTALGCGSGTIVKGKPLYRSGYKRFSEKYLWEVYLMGMDMPLKTHENVIINEIPTDVRSRVDAMARDLIHKEITVTSLSNINFRTYRMGEIKAYDVNDDKEIDFVILEPVAKLFKPVWVEISGDSDEISLFMIASVKGKSIKRIYGVPGFYFSPRYHCVADFDGDGNLEILLVEGFGEAFHFEIYRLIDGNLVKLYSGTEFGC